MERCVPRSAVAALLILSHCSPSLLANTFVLSALKTSPSLRVHLLNPPATISPQIVPTPLLLFKANPPFRTLSSAPTSRNDLSRWRLRRCPSSSSSRPQLRRRQLEDIQSECMSVQEAQELEEVQVD